ncbi:MAG TPA: hypothetical protein VHC91_24810 [Trinickia sp.]|uniref:hypothetical protein n=1 Tax=Trinickia sp. TaxID=2571163 RepID=UPI002C919D35|nr:hypothetical protein [Trinickia sp.]HVW53589.1 hypothetical protein [Trinickia sp.]
MLQTHRVDREIAPHAAPTYLGSYVFPVLLLFFVVYRVGHWMAAHGVDFAGFGERGFQYPLMLAVFAVQLVAEGVFLAIAWVSRQADLERRFTTLSLGLVSSLLILAFDYGLQIAF